MWVRHYSVSWLGERVVADLRGMVVDHLMKLPLGWFHERRTGELVSRLASDVTTIENVAQTAARMIPRIQRFLRDFFFFFSGAFSVG